MQVLDGRQFVHGSDIGDGINTHDQVEAAVVHEPGEPRVLQEQSDSAGRQKRESAATGLRTFAGIQ
jgi:hypothetical protein